MSNETPTAGEALSAGPAQPSRGDDQGVSNPPGHWSVYVQRGADDMVRHTLREAESAAHGSPARFADLLFEQSQVMMLAAMKLVDAGTLATARAVRKQGSPAK